MGIYMVLASISVVPQLFSTLFMFRDPSGQNDTLGIVMTIAMMVLVFGLFYITLRYCLFKTDWIIDKLSLDKHFTEEKFDINIHRSTILSISVIVIGGLMFVDSLPVFCRQVFSYVRQKHSFGRFGENPTTGWLIFYGAKTFIAYLLLTNSRLVVNFIERQRKK
jgi:hypothetical protein